MGTGALHTAWTIFPALAARGFVILLSTDTQQ